MIARQRRNLIRLAHEPAGAVMEHKQKGHDAVVMPFPFGSRNSEMATLCLAGTGS